MTLGPDGRCASLALATTLRAASTAALLWLAWLPAEVSAQAASTSGIYSCIDEHGRRLTADRPIAECSAREQQLRNRDGSIRGVVPPTLTADERADKDARDRIAAEARAAQADAVRRDRNLTARYPNEAAHQRAREAALDTVRLAMRATEVRLRELAIERKPLQDEAEFYQRKPLPVKLRSALDANDAALEAQRSAQVNQEAELGRINRIYDAELDRLRRLWVGTPPGSLGPLSAAGAGSAPASQRPSAHGKPR